MCVCGCECMSSRMEFLLENEPLRIGGAHMITLKSSPDIYTCVHNISEISDR